MKKYICPVLLIACFYALTSCAQVKVPISKAHGYFVIPIPGIVAVDENGRELNNQRDTVIHVYIEVADKSIKWEKAWKGDRSFSLMAFPVTNEKAVVGK